MAAKNTMGATSSDFRKVLSGWKSSVSKASPVSCGRSFQNTLAHIDEMTYNVAKLPIMMAPTNAYWLSMKPASNKWILGQKPDSGGMPTSEKSTMAMTSDNSGYWAYRPPSFSMFMVRRSLRMSPAMRNMLVFAMMSWNSYRSAPVRAASEYMPKPPTMKPMWHTM